MSDKTADNEKQQQPIKIYKKRWFMLLLFCIFGISNTLQFIQYSIVADVVVEYYNVSYTAVDWSSMIFSVTYIVFSFPGVYVLDKLGLRTSILIGAVGTALGSWIKVLSVHPDRYWVALFGQGILSIFQICIFPLAPKVAANWFGADEISRAGALAWVGVLIGNAIGFIIPPFLIARGDTELIERGFYIINLSYAALSTIAVLLVYFCFSEQPITPPSFAQQKVIESNNVEATSIKQSIKNLSTNKSYLLYLILLAVNIAIFNPFQVLLNQIILLYYPDASDHAGIIGLLDSLVSFVGSILVCVILDEFKKFKETTLVTHGLYFLSLVCFVTTLDQGIAVVYITSILFGFLQGAVLTLGVQVVIELTYPEAEYISTGLCVNLVSLFTILLTMLYSHIFKNVNIMWANITICLITFGVDLLFLFMKFDLRRQRVEIEPIKSATT